MLAAVAVDQVAVGHLALVEMVAVAMKVLMELMGSAAVVVVALLERPGAMAATA